MARASDASGGMFHGLKIWIAQRVPTRTHFIEDVKSNGGQVVPLEQQADVKIVDHLRKDPPPDSYSYQFIEESIRQGTLARLEDHAITSSKESARNIGSITQSAKATRTRFTAAEDRILWDWVNENPQKGGGTEGNEIYKQLEKKHPSHPWQAWRDRYIKKLKGRPKPYATVPHQPSDPSYDKDSINTHRKQSSPAPPKSPPVHSERHDKASKTKEHEEDSLDADPGYRTNMERLHHPINAPVNTHIPDTVQGSSTTSTSSYDTAATHRESHEPQLTHAERSTLREKVLRNANQHTLKRKFRELSENERVGHPRHGRPAVEKHKEHQSRNRTEVPFNTIKDRVEISPFPEDHNVRVKTEPPEEIDDNDLWSHHLDGDFANGMEEVFMDGIRYRESTQALYKQPTPSIGLDIPPPDEGWGDLEETESLQVRTRDDDHERNESPDLAALAALAPDTQALFRDRTQSPDLGIPDPDDANDSLRPSSPPKIPRLHQDAESDTSTAELSAQADAWIDSYVAQGFSVDTVLAAFKSTSHDSELTEKVLEHLRKQKEQSGQADHDELPHDWQGVWTASDDEDLSSTDARQINRLQVKHGAEALNNRWEFLDFLDRL